MGSINKAISITESIFISPQNRDLDPPSPHKKSHQPSNSLATLHQRQQVADRTSTSPVPKQAYRLNNTNQVAISSNKSRTDHRTRKYDHARDDSNDDRSSNKSIAISKKSIQLNELTPSRKVRKTEVVINSRIGKVSFEQDSQPVSIKELAQTSSQFKSNIDKLKSLCQTNKVGKSQIELNNNGMKSRSGSNRTSVDQKKGYSSQNQSRISAETRIQPQQATKHLKTSSILRAAQTGSVYLKKEGSMTNSRVIN